MDSILQREHSRCWLCGRRGTSVDPLDCHHVFFGPFRDASERYGLKVYLHHAKCHIFGKDAVHMNAKVCRSMQEEAQSIAMEFYGWTVDDFIMIFGRNYL